MNAQKNGKLILYIKNNEMNWAPISQQTKNIRKITNEKIRYLGDRYYKIKNLFDKFKFKRDDLFIIAKDFEKEYKNIKPNIHLQNQFRRMKEALVCWFCEHFFEEIVKPNSAFLIRMIEKTKNIESLNQKINHANQIKSQPKIINKKAKMNKNIKATNQTQTDKDNHQSNFLEYNINQEIDTFNHVRISTNILDDSQNNSVIENENFNFEKFLNF